MSCPQVDNCSKKREFPEDELWELCQAAYAQYQIEIVNGRKKYHRYVSDFLSFHIPIESTDITDRRIHSRNLSTMAALFTERQDLVNSYFTRPNFDFENFTNLIEELNCEGDSLPRSFQFNEVVNYMECPSSERLACLSTEQVFYLTEFFNSNDFFSKKLTFEETANFFECCLQQPLQSLNNSRIAMFLFCLRDQQILSFKWQKLIQDNKLILSSSNGQPLKTSNISNALTEYRRVHGGPDPYFVHVAKYLKGMTE